LGPALDVVTAAAEPVPPTQLVLITDAAADLPDVDALAAAMQRGNVRLHLLAIGDAGGAADAGLQLLRRLVSDTGGTLVEEKDPARWAGAARELLRAAGGRQIESVPATVDFLGDLRTLSRRQVAPWNRTWLKPGATVLAQTTPPGETVAADREGAPLAARWSAGEGAVAAVAFAGATAQEVEALQKLVARPPRDPRLRVTWNAGSRLSVRVDATGADGYLNGLSLSLHIEDPAQPGGRSDAIPVPQTGPGEYEVSVEAPGSPAFAAVRHNGRTIDRTAVAGRYAAEFAAVGNDRAALRELARRSGGGLIEPSATGALDPPRPRRDVPLTSPLAAAGAACVAVALLWWRMS
jgi:hypothetical protein